MRTRETDFARSSAGFVGMPGDDGGLSRDFVYLKRKGKMKEATKGKGDKYRESRRRRGSYRVS
ncbi:unnamed protein product, partial [Dovyalis caffra]